MSAKETAPREECQALCSADADVTRCIDFCRDLLNKDAGPMRVPVTLSMAETNVTTKFIKNLEIFGR
jgi:hypothetical protein